MQHMKITKAYQFRLYPTKEQEVLIHQTFGCTRFLYNQMLDEKKKDKILSKFDLFKKYNKLKNKNSTGATLGNVVSTKEKRNTVRYSKGRNRKFIFY